MFHSKGDQINVGSYVPYLGAECRDILLSMQVKTDGIFLIPPSFLFDIYKHVGTA